MWNVSMIPRRSASLNDPLSLIPGGDIRIESRFPNLFLNSSATPVTNGEAVASVLNYWGGGVVFQNTIGSQRPTWQTGFIAGHGGMIFDSDAQQYLESVSNVDSNNQSLYFLAKMGGIGGGRRCGGYAQGRSFGGFGAGGQWGFYQVDVTDIADMGGDYTSITLIGIHIHPDFSLITETAGNESNFVIQSAWQPPWAKLYLASNPALEYGDAQIAGVWHWPRVINSLERSIVRSYVLENYGTIG